MRPHEVVMIGSVVVSDEIYFVPIYDSRESTVCSSEIFHWRTLRHYPHPTVSQPISRSKFKNYKETYGVQQQSHPLIGVL